MELASEPPIFVEDITSGTLEAELRRAVDGMNLALDIGDWAEAATLREWARQLRVAIDVMKEEDE